MSCSSHHPFDFSDRVALVTGGSRGIGRALTEKLAGCGARVFFCGTNPELGHRAAKEINQGLPTGNPPTTFLAANVADYETCNRMISDIFKEAGRLDFLVNNAGITRDNLLMRLKESDWDEVMAVNLKGCFNCARAAARGMLKQRYGRLLFLSSVIGLMGNAGQANYAAAKAGIIGLARSLAKELASRNITSNIIAPGYIQTDMTAALDEKTKNEISSAIPLGRLGSSDDVANAALFLLSPLADYITGQVLQVDGGMLTA
jgi:3-oxoacyl-[acyl-carrier protein] reductase